MIHSNPLYSAEFPPIFEAAFQGHEDQLRYFLNSVFFKLCAPPETSGVQCSVDVDFFLDKQQAEHRAGPSGWVGQIHPEGICIVTRGSDPLGLELCNNISSFIPTLNVLGPRFSKYISMNMSCWRHSSECSFAPVFETFETTLVPNSNGLH